MATASTGLAVWVGFLASGVSAVAWLAVLVLVVNNGVGDFLTTGRCHRHLTDACPCRPAPTSSR